jgi:hypothetical protein
MMTRIVRMMVMLRGNDDQTGRQLNILPGTCVININLSCLYHVFPRIAIPRNVLPDPIRLDFLAISKWISTNVRNQMTKIELLSLFQF